MPTREEIDRWWTEPGMRRRRLTEAELAERRMSRPPPEVWLDEEEIVMVGPGRVRRCRVCGGRGLVVPNDALGLRRVTIDPRTCAARWCVACDGQGVEPCETVPRRVRNAFGLIRERRR